MDREELYQRINQTGRADDGTGLLDEVKSLSTFRHLTAMKTVGYRELFRYLDGEISLEEAVDLIKRNTRKFARKQLTWFRKGKPYTNGFTRTTEEIIPWIEKHRIRRSRNLLVEIPVESRELIPSQDQSAPESPAEIPCHNQRTGYRW